MGGFVRGMYTAFNLHAASGCRVWLSLASLVICVLWPPPFSYIIMFLLRLRLRQHHVQCLVTCTSLGGGGGMRDSSHVTGGDKLLGLLNSQPPPASFDPGTTRLPSASPEVGIYQVRRVVPDYSHGVVDQLLDGPLHTAPGALERPHIAIKVIEAHVIQLA